MLRFISSRTQAHGGVERSLEHDRERTPVLICTIGSRMGEFVRYHCVIVAYRREISRKYGAAMTHFRSLGVASPVVLSYLTCVMKDGSEQEPLLLGSIAEAVILLLESVLQILQSGLVEHLSCARGICASDRNIDVLHVAVEMVAKGLLLAFSRH